MDEIRKLKKLNLDRKKLEQCSKELIKIEQEMHKYNDKVFKLIKIAFDKDLFSKEMIKKATEMANEINEQCKDDRPIEPYCFLFADYKKIKNIELKRRIEKADKKVNLLDRKRHKILEEKYNLMLEEEYEVQWGYDKKEYMLPPEPVRLLTRYGLEPAFTGNKELDRDTINAAIKNNLLKICIDLTYDKQDILTQVKDVVGIGQKIIEKPQGKGRRTGAYYDEQYRLVKKILLKHYKAAKTQTEAIVKTTEEIGTLGHNISGNNIRRKYLPKIIKEYGVKNTIDLKTVKN